MGGEDAEALDAAEFHARVLELGEAGLAALVLGLALIVFLAAVRTVRHL